MDPGATLLPASPHVRQKRVLPSRSRRGGPGVGNCDVDVMILNAQMNKSENDPLIPADTPFVLKTSDTLEKVAGEFSSAGGSGLNLRAHDSYFDRPDVLKAYREQTIIETPEFRNVADEPNVGGRLRIRQMDENNSDLDASYEKRHRKYESFEKRQRLREKEKLKHEQYKLKERIEQLRGMENAAFLPLPASSFSPRPGVVEVVEEDPILGGLNGTPGYAEGERRRKEMLATAQILEERYRVLLPPDRQRKPTGKSSGLASIDPDSEFSGKEFTHPHEDAESDDEDYAIPVPKKETTKLKLKLPARPNLATPSIPASKAAPSSSKKRRRSLPPPFNPAPLPPPKSPAVRKPRAPDATPMLLGREILSTAEPGPSTFVQPLTTFVPPPDIPMSRPQVEVMPNLRFMEYEPDTIYPKRSHKRQRTEERGLPSPPDHSVHHPEDYIVVDEEPIPPKRSSSPIDEPEISSYSYPPPPPPPADDYPSPETTVPPPDAVSPGPVSPLDSDPGPNPYLSVDYFSELQPQTPPHPLPRPHSPAEEASIFVHPPEPIEYERKASVPPIAWISSAPVPTTSRRGRSRGGAKPGAVRKAPKRRDCNLVSFADRTSKNPRQLKHNRHIEAFGAKLPPIIHNSSDSYDFELPPEVLERPERPGYEDRTQDADTTQELEGSQGPDDPDPTKDEDELDEHLDSRPSTLEPVDDPADDTQADEDSDGT